MAQRLSEAFATTPGGMFQRKKNVEEPQGLNREPCATLASRDFRDDAGQRVPTQEERRRIAGLEPRALRYACCHVGYTGVADFAAAGERFKIAILRPADVLRRVKP